MWATTFLIVRGISKKAVAEHQNQQYWHRILQEQVSYTLSEINGKA